MADKSGRYQPDHGIPSFQGGDRQTQGAGVMIRNWKGMMSNGSPHALGTEFVQIQENVQSIVLGQIWGRAGFREVLFDG